MTDPIARTSLPLSHPVRASRVTGKRAIPFDLRPDARVRQAIADDLGILTVRKLRFRGEVGPLGRADAILTGRLEADVDQACILTLEPVPARIDVAVERRYFADMDPETADEAEIPGDVDAEPLPDSIDAGAVALEALALALPLYPRRDGATLARATAEPAGAEPLKDADLRPFAGLAALRSRLEGRPETEPEEGSDAGQKKP